jgi:hypothetical protein
VSGATAWTDHVDGLDYILVINDGVWMPSTVKASLMNSNQRQLTAQRFRIPLSVEQYLLKTQMK